MTASVIRCAMLALLVAQSLPVAAVTADEFFGPPPEGYAENAPTGLLFGIRPDGFPEDRFDEAGALHLAVPETYTPYREHPVIIVLHGGGNGGFTSATELMGPWANIIKGYGAIGVFPQALYNNRISEWNYPELVAYVFHVIEVVSRSYNIDPRRIHLMGHSMGGSGTMLQGVVMDGLYAAISPQSGNYSTVTSVGGWGRLGDMPLFMAHGVDDGTFGTDIGQADDAESRLVDAGNSFGEGGLSVYLRMEDVGHNIFDNLPGDYRGWTQLCVDWLLKRPRTDAPDIANEIAKVDSYFEVQYGEGAAVYSYGRTPVGIWGVAENTRPVLNEAATASATTVAPGEGVVFTVDGSDADSWFWPRWDFGDGSDIGWEEREVHAYAEPGEYSVTCFLFDAHGLATEAGELTITVVDDQAVTEVGIVASDQNAAEAGTDPGVFTVSRTGDTSAALSVSWQPGGSASVTNNADVETGDLPDPIVIPAGESSVTVTVTPKKDSRTEGVEFFGISLMRGEGYRLGSDRDAFIAIQDDDVGDQPLITLRTIEAIAIEGGAAAVVRAYRAGGDQSQALAVNVTAVVDDEGELQIDLPATIPAGSAWVDIPVMAIADDKDEGVESNLIIVATGEDPDDYGSGTTAYTAINVHDQQGPSDRWRTITIRADAAGGSSIAILPSIPASGVSGTDQGDGSWLFDGLTLGRDWTVTIADPEDG